MFFVAVKRHTIFSIFFSPFWIQGVSACAGDCNNDWWKWICVGFGVIFFLALASFLKRMKRMQRTVGPGSAKCEQGCSDKVRSMCEGQDNQNGGGANCVVTVSRIAVTAHPSFHHDIGGRAGELQDRTSTTNSSHHPHNIPIHPPTPGELYYSEEITPPPAVSITTDPPPTYESVIGS